MFVLLAIALLVGLVVTFWLVGHLVGLALMLLMAALVAYVADSLVPGRVPYGWPGLALVGLVGGWIGTALVGRIGPHLFGVWVVPAFVGALVLTLVISLVAGRSRRGAY